MNTKKIILLILAVVILLGGSIILFTREAPTRDLSPREQRDIDELASELFIAFPEERFPYLYEPTRERVIDVAYYEELETVRVSRDDYEVRIPWSEPLDITEEGNGEIVSVESAAHEKRLLMWESEEIDLWEEFTRGMSERNVSVIRAHLGDDVVNSTYLLRGAFLNVTLDDVREARSINEAEAQTRLLMRKMDLPVEGGTYSFETDDVRGYVLVDSGSGRYIKIYPKDDDNRQYRLSGQLDDEDIDSIISSFRIID